jgi:hypothetical protein
MPAFGGIADIDRWYRNIHYLGAISGWKLLLRNLTCERISLCFNVGGLDYLGPLLGRCSNKFCEFGLCAGEWSVAQLQCPRRELGLGNAKINLAVQSLDNISRSISWGADSLPRGSLVARQELADAWYVWQRVVGARFDAAYEIYAHIGVAEHEGMRPERLATLVT